MFDYSLRSKTCILATSILLFYTATIHAGLEDQNKKNSLIDLAQKFDLLVKSSQDLQSKKIESVYRSKGFFIDPAEANKILQDVYLITFEELPKYSKIVESKKKLNELNQNVERNKNTISYAKLTSLSLLFGLVLSVDKIESKSFHYGAIGVGSMIALSAVIAFIKLLQNDSIHYQKIPLTNDYYRNLNLTLENDIFWDELSRLGYNVPTEKKPERARWLERLNKEVEEALNSGFRIPTCQETLLPKKTKTIDAEFEAEVEAQAMEESAVLKQK